MHRLLTIPLLAISLSIPGQSLAADISDSYRNAALALLTHLRAETRLAALRAALIAGEIKRDKRMDEHKATLAAHLEKYMGWEQVRDDIIAGYHQEFTEKDLRDILDFYRSPVGIKVLAHMERLNQEAFSRGAQRSQAHHNELRQKILGGQGG